MGFASRRPTLPAPTDSLLESADDTGLGTDNATDLSRVTERTSHTIPDDGSPITITTSQKKTTIGKLVKSGNQSQTSLLIEYFEGGPGPEKRPSVRVKVTPSGRKNKERGAGHVLVTESANTGGRRASLSHKIGLGTENSESLAAASSISALDSEVRFPRSRAPVEIEVLENHSSEVSGRSHSPAAKFIVPGSDISSMPADSMVGPTHHFVSTGPGASRSMSDDVSRSDLVETDSKTLRPPVMPTGRNLSNERITQKVIEKLSNKPRVVSSGKRHHRDKSRSHSSVSRETDVIREPRVRSSKLAESESMTTATGSSLASGSLLSADPRYTDQRSAVSGTSTVSINNPKLLQTVEDAIRRLILPELKELKKDQRSASHYSRHEKDMVPSDFSESSVSRDETTSRRVSGGKSRRRSSKGGDVVSSGTKHRHRKTTDYESPSDLSRRYSESIDSVSIDDNNKSRPSHKDRKLRDVAAGALVGGGLTAAALKHHDSESSLERKGHRKSHSKSRSSRSASIAEAEDIFYKHDVPPMPMRSEIDSELTRSSLLSSNTAGTATPIQREVREVVRGSPHQLRSPGNSTPSAQVGDRTHNTVQRGLGTYHGNHSERDLAKRTAETGYHVDDEQQDIYDSGYRSLDNSLLTDAERAKAYERNLHHQHPIRRGLSPIQSVASYATTEPRRNSMALQRSVESLNSPKRRQEVIRDDVSDSLSSVSSIEMAKSRRPQGINLENRSEIMKPHLNDGVARETDVDDFFEEQHAQNDQYRNSYASDDHQIPLQNMTNYTDESIDDPYLDKVTAGQQVARGYGANPEYIHTPPGVESAVASLIDPSVLDLRSPQSSYVTQQEHSPILSHRQSIEHYEQANPYPTQHDLQTRRSASPFVEQHGMQAGMIASPYSGHRDLGSMRSDSPASQHYEQGIVQSGSPLKQQLSRNSTRDTIQQADVLRPSPPQSAASSRDDFAQNTSQLPDSTNVMNVARHSLGQTSDGHAADSPQSEITTNPSVIQGPIGGVAHGSRDHWPYNPTPPRSKTNVVIGGATRDADVIGADLVPEALSINRTAGFDSKREAFMSNAHDLTPPGVKDEGYETGNANATSPAVYARDRKVMEAKSYTPAAEMNDMEDRDPFIAENRTKYVSGLSQGMSPLYDSATGRGIDRIQSKDVVALMDHLTVRDAQRNARDTEILVTLVRSAAEMRNSFEDLKKFIAEQNDLNMDVSDKQHEQTQKAIGGPRPLPQSVSGTRMARTPISEEEDLPTKRRNVFKRALRGLGTKNQQELQNIEAMLMQLLDNVEDLRVHQGLTTTQDEQRKTSYNSTDQARAPTDPGYEPEGFAGSSSAGDRSGVFSNSSSRQANIRNTSGPHTTGNRVSTVLEGDEEYDEYNFGAQNHGTDPQRTPKATPHMEQQFQSGAAGNTPRKEAAQVSWSNQNTPQMSNDGGNKTKHKSFASSLFPKMVSRWSKTTASSAPDNHRSSTQGRQRPYSGVSQSGSHLEDYEYDPEGDDRLRSTDSFQNDQYRGQQNRPPSPLVPSQVSDNPKYQAVRNSINLQHPQPRQGPTGRYQQQLESEAHYYTNDFNSPTSHTSSQWETQAALTGLPGAGPNGAYMHGSQLSPIPDGYSEISEGDEARSYRSTSTASRGPARPSNVLDDEPLVPQRPSKQLMSPGGQRQSTYVDHVTAARAGSPAYDKSPVAAIRSSPGQNRKPSGPRPLSTSGQNVKGQKGDFNTIKKTRFRGSPNHIDSPETRGY